MRSVIDRDFPLAHAAVCYRSSYYLNIGIFGGLVAAQILLWLFGIWMIDVKCLVEYQGCPSTHKATHCKVRQDLTKDAAPPRPQVVCVA